MQAKKIFIHLPFHHFPTHFFTITHFLIDKVKTFNHAYIHHSLTRSFTNLPIKIISTHMFVSRPKLWISTLFKTIS